ncbi:Quinate permease [Apiospora aurea]|uniref:Quinate permease n=1 Tax=Apiospora aurea TaxID=335848 RepID=A0ABR1QDG4_9PEZI
MGGGTSIWASPEWRSDPGEIFNWKMFYLTTSVAFAGCAYGFDQGSIGGVLTLESFRHAFGLDVMSEADADERVAAGGSAGALLAAPCADFLGRKKSMILYGFLFLIGATMQMGYTLHIPPTSRHHYLHCSVSYQTETLGLAFWVNYGISLWPSSSDLQWKLALAIQIIPGGSMFLSMFDHPYVHQEYSEICAQVDAEQELTKGTIYWVVIKDIFTIRSNTRRLFRATTLFVFHKFTGTDSLNYFAPEVFQMIGVKAGSLSLLTTGVYGLVKLATTIVYVTVIVDRVGRRKPLRIGATLQATAMLYIALYVKFGKPDSTGGTPASGIVGIIWVYIYAFGWSFGHSVAPYITTAEIFPARIRSFSMSCCFFINWIVDYGITKATPIMMTKLGWDTFLLYAILTCIGCAFIFFRNSTWTMWRHAYPTGEDKVRHDVQDQTVQMAKDEEAGFDKKHDEATVVHRENL